MTIQHEHMTERTCRLVCLSYVEVIIHENARGT